MGFDCNLQVPVQKMEFGKRGVFNVCDEGTKRSGG